jgi:protein-disulfide isomerase
VNGLRQKHNAQDLLEPPRVKVDASGFAKGPKDAPITIVEFADYECGYCSRAMESINQVMAKYPGKIRLVYRDFPLEFHQNAVPASIAARCAGAQSKFWEMHTKLFENQSGLTVENFTKWAGELGLDMTKFDACSKDQMVMASIQADIQAGSSLGVSGTPAFFVNGVSLSGAQPPEAFIKIIDRELARLKNK